jgi:hypothetical protein
MLTNTVLVDDLVLVHNTILVHNLEISKTPVTLCTIYACACALFDTKFNPLLHNTEQQTEIVSFCARLHVTIPGFFLFEMCAGARRIVL